MANCGSCALKYDSLESINEASELTKEMIARLKTHSSEKMFLSIEKMMQEARIARGDIEKQYMLYYRCAQLSKLIYKQNDFATFKAEHGAIFGLLFKEALDEADNLKAILSKKYEEKMLRISHSASVDKKIVKDDSAAVFKQEFCSSSNILISPKELVRMVEHAKPKKTAVIVDFRKEKSELISYRNDHVITVITVPFELIVHGLIFTSLRNQLEVGQRPLLHRIGSCDLVVLMSDTGIELKNGEPVRGSPAHLLSMALYEYNHEHHPKSRPLFMDGGFDNWRDQYPVYTRCNGTLKRNEPRDQLDHMVNNYKKACLMLDYPDLSPQQSVQQFHDTPAVNESVTVGAPKRDLKKVSGTAEVFALLSMLCVLIIQCLHHLRHLNRRSTSNYFIRIPTSPLPLVISIINFFTSESRQTCNAVLPQPRLPLPDRSTKPILMSIDQEQQLLDIYNSMCNSTEGSVNRCGNPRPGYTGLYNMGNTCFMNATLQALFHTPLMLSVFSKENFLSRVNPQNKMGTGGVISAVFSAMMDVIWSGQYTAIKPQRFLRLFASQVNACLADGHQHDASEFQLFLLDALHEDTNQVTKRVSFEQNYRGGSQIVNDAKDYERKSRLFACSPVNKIFNLQTVSELSCSACGEQSATFEECSLITVELPMHTSRTSLQQCLSSHFSQTTLDGDSRWNCPRCRAPKRASRLTKLWSLPPVVVVHLKRFSIENGDYAKNTMPVDFDPTRLDLSEYLHENSPESSETYKLYAVTNHSGRLNSGHYTALVCHGTTGEWLRFDDESVSTSSASGISTSEAYMLYYKRT
ncbi:hypothetical protein Angca_006365 [Angiostrongylus cantonensis]|nr:hypothetical protein Angca_006365 [Angiostrongylus cantonensis]